MFIAGSRFVSEWFSLGGGAPSADAYSEGSPIDRAVFFSLVGIGAFILSKRNIDWGKLLSENKWLAVYFLYCLCSIGWADEPFVLFKRWIKDLGNPIMALIILTDERPFEAAGLVLRRFTFLMLPLSFVTIRYFPSISRGYSPGGGTEYQGIGTDKNSLGMMCLISGIYFGWEYLQNRSTDAVSKRRGWRANWMDYTLIALCIWLLNMSDSQTSTLCLILSIAIFVIGRVGFIKRKPSRIVLLVVSVAFVFMVADDLFNLRGSIYHAIGRNETLTDRTALWEIVKRHEVNSLVGAGFMSFWTGARMETIWKEVGQPGINQAHNGYLEQYMNLGYVGVGFMVAILLSALLRIRKELNTNRSAAMLRFSFVVTAILYNYTEASFYGINCIWVLTLLAAITLPVPAEQAQGVARAMIGKNYQGAYVPSHTGNV
jgi:O-antigen ligase